MFRKFLVAVGDQGVGVRLVRDALPVEEVVLAAAATSFSYAYAAPNFHEFVHLGSKPPQIRSAKG